MAVCDWYVDDLTGAGMPPTQIPSGTVIPAGGRWVVELGTGYLNNTGDRVRFTDPSGREYDGYSCSTTQ